MGKDSADSLKTNRSMKLTRDLLQGAIDIHVHPGPHLVSSPRRVNPFEAAIEARDAGMQAMVLKDVFEMSNGTAWMVNQIVEDFHVYGGLILNTVYGGMNPRAFKTAIYYGDGAKYLDFGAHSTYYQAAKEGRYFDGEFKPLAEVYPKFREKELGRAIKIPLEGDVPEELDEMLTLAAEHPHIYVDTGHISAEEAMRLVDLSKKYGYKKIVVSSSVSKIATINQLKEMAKKCAFIEYTL